MKPLIVANWKMNPQTIDEAKKLFVSVREGIKDIKGAETIICAPFVYLSVLNQYKGNFLEIGAQDAFWEEKGAYTGEVSPGMLKELGIKYVILGHSERRRHLQETDEMINKKIKKSLELGLSPILCVGDMKREAKDDKKEIALKIEKDLADLPRESLNRLIVTYEPIWAISTTKGGAEATPEDAKEGVVYIRKILSELLGKDLAGKIKILYGGSADSKNINNYLCKGEAAGVLVGAASLKSEEFINTVKNSTKACKT